MTDQIIIKHLWEVEHPYYGSGSEENFDSWETFYEEWGPQSGTDLDLNFLYRWDWMSPDEDAERDADELHLFYILQRKSRITEVIVKVQRADEAVIIDYLKPLLAYALKLWEPIA